MVTSKQTEDCFGKVRFGTKQQAQWAFRHYKANMHRNRGRVVDRMRKDQRPYKCPVCGGWHLTSRDR